MILKAIMNNLFNKKLFQNIFYYVLLLLGLVMTSWIIWSRFIRIRTIRDIPDSLLTEFRFWILLYICFIYLLIIKQLLLPKESNFIIKETSLFFSDLIFKPLNILDRTIKFNHYIKSYYHNLIIKFFSFYHNVKDYQIIVFIFFIRIFPRIILVLFLLFDTFYFHKLELFYKVILIGLLPFFYRYLKYSVKDYYNYLIELLESQYKDVYVFEKGYMHDISRKRNTKAIHHYKRKTIKEYIEIKAENTIFYNFDEIEYEYVPHPMPHEQSYIKYAVDKYNNKDSELTKEDYDNLRKLFHNLIPLVMRLRFFNTRIKFLEEQPLIRFSKIVIFSFYLIAWIYILIISYKFYPVEFHLAKYFLNNIMLYLSWIDNPFAELYWGSLNENLLTKDKINIILKAIKTKFWNN